MPSSPRRWPLKIVYVLISNQDGCFRGSGVFWWEGGVGALDPSSSFPYVLQVSQGKAVPLKNLYLELCNPKNRSARDEGVRVQLQAELDPRNGLCLCFPICNQFWHPAQNLCSIYSDEGVKKGTHPNFPPVAWMVLQEAPQKDPGLVQETTAREGVWSNRDDRIWIGTCSSAQLPSLSCSLRGNIIATWSWPHSGTDFRAVKVLLKLRCC